MERKGTKCPWSYFLIRSVVGGCFLDCRSQSLPGYSSGLCSRYSTARSWSRIQARFRQTGNRGRCLAPRLTPFRSPESPVSCVRITATLSQMLCVFSGPMPSFVDLMSSQGSRNHRTIKGTSRLSSPLTGFLALDANDRAIKESQPPPSHCKGHPVRQADIHQLAD